MVQEWAYSRILELGTVRSSTQPGQSPYSPEEGIVTRDGSRSGLSYVGLLRAAFPGSRPQTQGVWVLQHLGQCTLSALQWPSPSFMVVLPRQSLLSFGDTFFPCDFITIYAIIIQIINVSWLSQGSGHFWGPVYGREYTTRSHPRAAGFRVSHSSLPSSLHATGLGGTLQGVRRGETAGAHSGVTVLIFFIIGMLGTCSFLGYQVYDCYCYEF